MFNKALKQALEAARQQLQAALARKAAVDRSTAMIEFKPDGTIIGRRIVQSSGNRAWDEAVLRALDKTETLPRDTDGRVPPALIIEFRPKD